MRKWTNEQSEAISAKWRDEEKTLGSNILVNAAAGSGKTAVLVERIINKLCANPSSPDYCGVENILVVTFTNAAAKEMKQRIGEALNQKFSEAIDNNDTVFAEHLKNQIKLVNHADITTIDSFCLKTVKNYFHLINIDPDFRIAENAECELLKDEAMEELFDSQYSDEKFIDLAFMLTDGRDTKEISELIKKLFQFTRSLPDPDKWLDEKKNEILIKDEGNKYFEIVKNQVYSELKYAKKLLFSALCDIINISFEQNTVYSEKEIKEITEKNPPYEENEIYLSFGTYYAAILTEYNLCSSSIGKSWDEMYEILNSFTFIPLNQAPTVKDKEKSIKDKEILSPLKNFRDTAKASIQSAQEYIFQTTDEIYKNSEEFLYPMICEAVDLCKKFENIYTEKKQKKNALEFSDIEHYCLKIIREHEDVRNLLKDKYSEILIDEYQDTNSLQEEIFTTISRGDNMFMVGDMKQSIYRFRNSDPGIFKEKNDTYKKEPLSENRKIVLAKNFRSREEVLMSVNSLFESIMSEKTGEIDYDEDQRLNLGNDDYSKIKSDFPDGYKSECCVIIGNSDDDEIEEDLGAVQTEARFIAKKIRELIDNNFTVYDRIEHEDVDEDGNIIKKQEGYLRPIRNKDIAILLSSHKNVSSIYQEELLNHGIDCYAEVGGYFEKSEITMALSLLKMINNPYNDLPLIAVMRSPIFAFSDDELCRIKLCGGEKFYDALKNASKSDSGEFGNKCLSFLKKLDKWREYKKIMSCDKLIWTLYRETGLYSFCESAYGEEAASNLRLLFMRAKGFEESGYKGLFNFIRYIGKMQKREEDLASAVTLGENSDVVRLMTIHKSKGLEFPVVFLAGCSKKFNTSDTKRKVLYHKELGFGADMIDYKNGICCKTLQKNAVVIKTNAEIVAEEMRKLYVATTRAKEKLFVTCVAPKKITQEFEEDKPSDYNKWISSIDSNGNFSKMHILSAGKYINWIAPVAMNDPDNWIFNIIPYSEAIKSDFTDFRDNSEDASDELPLVTITTKEYPFEEAAKLPSKISVTGIDTLLGNNRNTELIKKPSFLSENTEIKGAQKGTAVHYVMQKYVPTEDNSLENIQKFINELVKKEELTEEEAKAVNPKDIADFYNSEIGLRILNSDKVFRETPFEFEIPLKELTGSQSEEKIILQGIIDCYFYENDEIVLVDYKTDYSDNIEEIKERYRRQLQLYGIGLEKITKKRVKNRILYLFSSKSMIQYQ